MMLKHAALALSTALVASASFAVPMTVSDTYIGGDTPSGYGDTIGDVNKFNINSLSVEQSGSQFTFQINTTLADNAGVYGSLTADGNGIGFGDLFLASNWTPAGTSANGYLADNADTGTYWTYALGLDNHFGTPGSSGNVTLYQLNGATNDANSIQSQDLMSGGIYRTDQEVLVNTNSATALSTLGAWSLTNSDLTLSIDLTGTDLLDANQLAFHWAMYCANDVIEGMVDITTVPEPTTLMLLGLGLCGLVLARRRQASAL